MRSKKVMKTLTNLLPYVLLAVAAYLVYTMYVKEGFDVSGDLLEVEKDTRLYDDASGSLATATQAQKDAQKAYDDAKKAVDDAKTNKPKLDSALSKANTALGKAKETAKAAAKTNTSAKLTLEAAKEQLDYDSMPVPYNTAKYTANKKSWSTSSHKSGSQAYYDGVVKSFPLDSDKYTWFMAAASFAKHNATGGWHSRAVFTGAAKKYAPPTTPKPVDAVDWTDGKWVTLKPKVTIAGHTVANCFDGTEPNIAKNACVLSCPKTATGSAAYGGVDYCTY